jgi:hypothetical protein
MFHRLTLLKRQWTLAKMFSATLLGRLATGSSRAIFKMTPGWLARRWKLRPVGHLYFLMFGAKRSLQGSALEQPLRQALFRLFRLIKISCLAMSQPTLALPMRLALLLLRDLVHLNSEVLPDGCLETS